MIVCTFSQNDRITKAYLEWNFHDAQLNMKEHNKRKSDCFTMKRSCELSKTLWTKMVLLAFNVSIQEHMNQSNDGNVHMFQTYILLYVVRWRFSCSPKVATLSPIIPR